MRIVRTVSMCLAALALAGFAPPAPERTDYRALFDALTSAVSENFYDPGMHGADWPRLQARYKAQLADLRSDDDFLRVGAALLAELKSSHVDLFRPAGTSAGGAGIGATVVAVGNESIVTEVAPLSHARRQGVRPGDRLLPGGSALYGPIGSEASVQLEDCAGTRRTVRVRRENALPGRQASFRWSVVDGGASRRIGYLRVDSFGDDAAPLADEAMAALADTDGLILDIRDNPGGNASALRLGSYFTDGENPALILLTRQYLAKLGHLPTKADALAAPKVLRAYTTAKVFEALRGNDGGIALWTEDLGARRYRNPVVVLQGPGTGSAAEGFGWLMRLKTDAILVGRPTAGALLGAERFDLGQGWSVGIPVHGIWAPNGENYGDRAVPPHVAVKWTRADLCKGMDPDLDRALSILEQKTSGDR